MSLVSYNSKSYWLRLALCVESKIVSFGSNETNATLVLAREEDSEQLVVVGEIKELS